MKFLYKLIRFLFVWLAFGPLLTAQKEDYVWLLGSYPNVPTEYFGGTQLDFNKEPVETSYYDALVYILGGASSICNPDGKLLFYSNGCNVINAEHRAMPNGRSINDGPTATNYCGAVGYYPTYSGVLALPHPGSTEHYLLIHIRDVGNLPGEVLYTKIDMTLDGGLGDVIEKNRLVFRDTLAPYLAAVRHGNGRDWWVYTYKIKGNRHYRFLLDPKGLHGPVPQDIGGDWNTDYWAGHSVFSPQGTRFARANPFNGLDIFNFDRCTGQLSRHQTLPILDSVGAAGVAFSPNGRYLYYSAVYYLYQFDLQAPDVAASRRLIDTLDGTFLDPFITPFYSMRLAPDGKIYICPNNGSRHLHIIHEPDQEGAACRLEQHTLQTPTYLGFMLPNFPTYRLYDFPNSPCDTLGIDGPIVETKTASPTEERGIGVWAWPNPVQGNISLHFRALFVGQIVLRDASGRVLREENVGVNEQHVLYMGDLPNGLYFLEGRYGEGRQGFHLKVIVAH